MVADAEAVRQTDEIPAWKREEVELITEMIRGYESVGVVGVTGIPSRQLQNMRRDLHGKAELRMGRNTLLRRALDDVDDGLETLIPEIHGQVGLIATNDNPFGLYRQLEASKTPAPINAGEVAPNDIVIPAGDTGMDPGPFVGELQQVGAEARIDAGSIKVTADSTVAAAGDVVSDQLAAVLSELEIEPKEVGLDLRAVYADGLLFEPEELAIDIDEYRADVQAAATGARNLSINAGYPTRATAPAMLQKAHAEATAVGISAAIEDAELVPMLVSRANAQLRQLASRIDDKEALPESLREVTTETAETTGEPTEAEESTDDQSEPPDEDSADEDDEDDGAEGLGALFG